MNDVPLFPLHTVLFPGGRLPLRIFEQRYLEMAKACLREGSPFGVCLIREGREVGAPATPAPVGCLARIAAWDMPQLGLLQVTARGERKFRILERRVEANGLARAAVELLPDDRDGAIPPQCDTCVQLLQRVIEQQSGLVQPPHRLASASWVSARLAEILPLPLGIRQELLELDDGRARLERLSALLRPAQP
ncbi:MAG TPA: LON peptidase substrate-binding domain-containing protein [Burkholderiales bacterium]|nr:LON peptidase substrate-binding domain-containing protein [Burkholderiales bacterium]